MARAAAIAVSNQPSPGRSQGTAAPASTPVASAPPAAAADGVFSGGHQDPNGDRLTLAGTGGSGRTGEGWYVPGGAAMGSAAPAGAVGPAGADGATGLRGSGGIGVEAVEAGLGAAGSG